MPRRDDEVFRRMHMNRPATDIEKFASTLLQDPIPQQAAALWPRCTPTSIEVDELKRRLNRLEAAVLYRDGGDPLRVVVATSEEVGRFVLSGRFVR